MSKLAVASLICVILLGNVVTVAVVLGERELERSPGSSGQALGDPDLAPLVQEIGSLRDDVNRLRGEIPGASASGADGSGASGSGPGPGDHAGASESGSTSETLATRLDEVLERLGRLEMSLAAMREFDEEMALEKLRAERQKQFAQEDGYALADELLAQGKFAVGANGILTFLDAHPEHPDAQDLMRRARDGFREAGYLDKALWMQGEIMTKFPEHRGGDLYQIAMLEKRMRKYDDAMRHIDESVALATETQDRMNRLFYRAYLLHTRDGDEVGLSAYREVERLARDAGVGPGDEAKRRADEIESRLASR